MTEPIRGLQAYLSKKTKITSHRLPAIFRQTAGNPSPGGPAREGIYCVGDFH